jgi:WD40 repeat protein
VAEDILASCSFESTIKFWDFKNNENYLLNIQEQNPVALEEVVSCINYCTTKGTIHRVLREFFYTLSSICKCLVGVLAAGTNYGRVLMWKYRELRKVDIEGPERWEFLTVSRLAGPLTAIKV